MNKINEVCIAYNLRHIDEICARATLNTAIVSLDFLVGRELQTRGVSFISSRDLLSDEVTEEGWWLLAQNVAREWYRLPAMKFFEHNGIRIAEALEPIMEGYLSRLFFYVRIYTVLKKEYPNAVFYIPLPVVNDASTAGCLISFERWAVIDAARIAGLQSAIVGERAAAPKGHLFPRTVWKSLLVHAYNALVGLAPRRKLKVFASEYWSHIAPIMAQMDDTELVLMEVSELKHIPWRQILKHRIRIRHPADAIQGSMKLAAFARSGEFMEQWETAKKEVVAYLSSVRAELDWSPVLEACEYLITYSPRVITDIDALRRIMEEEKPDIILQLASVGGRRHHFLLMARISAQLKIPSVELQHGVAYLDPRSIYSRIETDHLASYGTDVNRWHERIGNARSRLIAVGSPRFDRCINARTQALEKGKQLFQKLGLDTKRPVLLAAVPEFDVSVFWFDSYQFADFFEAVHTAQSKVPGLQVLFKCRNQRYIDATKGHFKGLLPADSVVVGNKDLFALLSASDAVVCGNSTVLYEAVLAKNPLVLYPWKVFDTYNARIYAQVIPLVHKEEELVEVLAHIFKDVLYREELLTRQKQFLTGYSFDGRSSERIVAFLRSLPQRSRD